MTRSKVRAALLLATTVAVIGLSGAQHAAASGATSATVAFPAYNSLDPAVASDTKEWQVEYATCLTLYTFPDDPAPAGYQFVPEAATALPAVSADGRVYTFTIKSGLRFSDGSDVTADSFRRAIERTAQPYAADSDDATLNDIAGFGAFHDGSAASISGVQVTGNQLQITLTEPDGALPAVLATPYFCAVPADTPLIEQDTVPLPSAGPYYIDSGSVSTDGPRILGFRLLKNPYYTGSRPAVLDEIDVITNPDESASYASAKDPNPSIYSEPVDYTKVAPADQAAANASFGPGSPAAAAGHQQYFTPTIGAVRYLMFNTSRSGLSGTDGTLVRRAIATAIDRTQLASDLGETPTDDFVSSTTPGYVDEHIFDLSGDVAAAQALMQEAGYGPGNRLMLKLVIPPSRVPIVNDLVSELASIYIDVTYTVVPLYQYFPLLLDPASDWDLSYVQVEPASTDWADVVSLLLDGRKPGSLDYLDITHWNDAQTNASLDYDNALPSGIDRNTAFELLATSLAKQSAPMAAVAQVSDHEFVSARVGCVVHQPIYGLDLTRLCPANAVSAGDTYTQAGSVSSSTPVLAAVTASADGSVSVVDASASSELSGYDVVGQQVLINAPHAPDTDHPLSVTLTIDAGTLAAQGLTANTVTALRNGVAIPACSPNDGTVSHGDDPCVTSRTTDGNSNAVITILSTHASVWNSGKRDTTPPTLHSVSLRSHTIPVDGSTTISAFASADAVFAEFYVDHDAGKGKNIPLGGRAGRFVSPPYGALLSPGLHHIGVRVRDAARNWSSVSVITLSVRATTPNRGLIGLNGIDVSGGGIDSFDSSRGAYGGSNRGASAVVLSNKAVLLDGLNVRGDVVSTQGRVVLSTSAKVVGNVTAGGSVVNPQRVNGTVKQSAPSPPVAAPLVARCGRPYSSASGIHGGSFAYSPSTGNLTVYSGTVRLANGTYCFHNVSVPTNAKLSVGGPVTINLTGTFSAPSGRIVNRTYVPTNLRIVSSYAGLIGVSIAGGTYAYASILAPNTKVVIADGSFFGTVLARTLKVTGTALHMDVH
jgi:ABC-type transport system substrate-binding protein